MMSKENNIDMYKDITEKCGVYCTYQYKEISILN